MNRGDGNRNRKKRRRPRSSTGTAGRHRLLQAQLRTAGAGRRCMQRQRTGGGRRRGGSALLPGRLGAGGRPAQYRAHARGSCAQGAEAAPTRRKRWGQGRRRLQMQKKRGAGDRGLGCLYRGVEGILGLRVKKNGGTRPTRIGLRRRKKKRNGPDRWFGPKRFFSIFFFFCKKIQQIRFEF